MLSQWVLKFLTEQGFINAVDDNGNIDFLHNEYFYTCMLHKNDLQYINLLYITYKDFASAPFSHE